MIKAIDTFYKGIFYRSRLEARWAVFFEFMGIKFEYEPEGFTNGESRYLPDFFLSNVSLRGNPDGVYIEIKPPDFDSTGYREKMEWFDKPLVLFNGYPKDFVWANPESKEGGEQITPWWDNYMFIHKCDCCGHVKIEFWEGNYNDCYLCKVGQNDRLKVSHILEWASKERFK